MKQRFEYPDQKRKKWLIFSFALAILFCLTKYLSPFLISYLYRQSPDVLNQLTSSASLLPLDFYIGRMRTLYFGPMAQLTAGFSFLIICYFFLKESSLKVFWAAMFLFLLITKLDVLFLPPYGDSASGPLIEALWLKQHAFNYVELSKQAAFIDGGPKVYLFSLYPTFQALLMNLIPSIKLVMMINHLIVFALGAGMVALFKETISKVFSSMSALFLTFLILSLPLFQAQVEQINMEVPMAFWAIVSVYFLKDKKVFLAAMAAIVAMLIKGVAIVACLTVIVVCFVLLVFDKDKKIKLQSMASLIISGIVSLAMMYASVYILNDNQNVVMVGPLKGIRWMANYPLAYLLCLSFLISIQSLIKDLKSPKGKVLDVLNKYYVFLIMFVFVLSWFALYINSYGAQYRYRFLLVPFSSFCIFFAFAQIVKNEAVQKFFLASLIAVSLFASYGFFYDQPESNLDSEYERSLEYRNDLELDITVTKKIQNQYADYTIVAPFTMAQILAFPELGYVQKKLKVLLYGYPCVYQGIEVFKGLEFLNADQTMWIGVKTKLPANTAKLIPHYPVGPADKIIEHVYVGKKEAYLFQGGYSIEQRRILLQGTLKDNPNFRLDQNKF